jgi:hypothetical protein
VHVSMRAPTTVELIDRGLAVNGCGCCILESQLYTS